MEVPTPNAFDVVLISNQPLPPGRFTLPNVV